MNLGHEQPESRAKELKGAEPMLRADSSSALRSDGEGRDTVEGLGAERREAPPASGLVK